MKNTNMNAVLFAYVIVLLAMTNSLVSTTRVLKVGGAEGWHVPDENQTAMYSQWAARNRFHVGDSLFFKYKNDSVLLMEKFRYYHCNSSMQISVFENEETALIKLDQPGLFYIISGDPEHCKKGQRVIVDVMSQHGHSHSPPSMSIPPSIALPPQTYEEMSPSPSPLLSSGLIVSTSLVISVVLALVATIVILI